METVLFILAAIGAAADALTCLKCDSVAQPRLCNKAVECFDGELCSVQKFMNEFGEHNFKLGCLSSKTCGGFSHSTSQSLTVSCSECCDTGDLCNSKGCGEPGYPTERGPVCYDCPSHTNARPCHDIKFCFIGEVCSVVGKNLFSNIVYTSRCISKHECKSVDETHVAIIGKRSVDMHRQHAIIGKRSVDHQQHTCDACCSSDMCNKNCTTARVYNDPCKSNPCQHGDCVSKGTSYECSCASGYSGQFCDKDIDDCVSVNCGNGTCVDGIGDYTCVCNSGFNGNHCEHNIDDCATVNCGNGTCVDGIGDYTCVCNTGFTGNHCEHNIDDCASVNCGNGTCVDGINNYTCVCNTGFTGNHCEHRVETDCYDIYHFGGVRTDGVYTIETWKTHQRIQVFCDMSTDGGGWTVFQRRINGSVDFYRNFSEYENGFGDIKTEFWLGLRYMKELADQGKTYLRIDLVAASGTTGFEEFENFYLSASPDYTLHVGQTTDSLRISTSNSFGPYHHGSRFSTYDHDVDSDSRNCAVTYHGAWWYDDCYQANLNGKYLAPGTDDYKGIIYQSFQYSKTLKESTMLIRRR